MLRLSLLYYNLERNTHEAECLLYFFQYIFLLLDSSFYYRK